ncbi:nicotinamide riboside transporter PnuC [Cypionkella sp.]|uniref:nicotinamide riboside transporter PnuC n=1 Tax=Cypionkella sp. TaxID=2811411 RepID=UPI00261E4471|nr:nicotinamide riboside transporter PnuC [Cypionkella sp.]MDB5663782.1 pnuC [Cypionkella sp.]
MDEILTLLGGMFGTRAIEITAAICGLINVALIIRRSLWNYPFGLVMVALYAVIFFDYKLYSDAILQIFFFVIQVFGLFWWLAGRRETGELIVLRASPRQTAVVCAITLSAILAIGAAMSRYTDASLPYWDACIATLSVIAQSMLARRLLENWLVWIVVDIIAINVFLAKGLHPTAVLYAVFLGLALLGLIQWRKAWLGQQA